MKKATQYFGGRGRIAGFYSSLSFLVVLCVPGFVMGASNNIWSVDSDVSTVSQGERNFYPQRHLTLTLNMRELKKVLTTVPLERTESARRANIALVLPLPDGQTGRFRIVESPIMEPGLAAKFPDIHTYSGQGIDDRGSTVRFDLTAAGFHAMVRSPKGTVYIDPCSRNDTDHYVSYYRRDLYTEGAALIGGWTCGVIDEPNMTAETRRLIESGIFATSGSELRTYRLACAATAEYTQFFGGTVELGLAAIVTAINRVTGIYETEVAIRLTLVANNNMLVYTNSATDPYTNNSPSSMLSENQANIDAVIGNANYDIGHVFSTAGGGLAGVGVVCRLGVKARGVTGTSSPVGDAFYVDYVAHEMGHQFGGNHSFNGNSGSCGGGNRHASTAYEPGSGSTIMAYAGICGLQNLQPHSDPYFHTISFDEIVAYTTAGSGNCPTPVSTGNNPPLLVAGASGFTIPISTPFRLTGAASDLDNDPLTYSWEEFDLGPAGAPDSPSGTAPIFRCFNPVSSPTRVFPALSDLLNNTHTIGEILPTYERGLGFRLTARDNRSGGGGVNYASMSFSVTESAGPFEVTAPNTAVSWPATSAQTVTWNVANTNTSPVSCSTVNILLSTDGGQTFPLTLASDTPNDGSELITVPDSRSSTARVMVEAIGNIFFDVSNVNFTVDAPVPIQLATFTGRSAGGNDVILEWRTISEIINYGFEIQKAAERDVEYLTIPNSFITGHGTTIVPQDYSFVDHSGTTGMQYYRLKQIDLDGAIHFSDAIYIPIMTGVAENSPARFELLQNSPNPFNPATVINYQLPFHKHVTLKVYDLLGQEMATLVDGAEEPGFKSAMFDASNLPSGVYIYRLEAGGFVTAKKLLLLR